MKEKLSSALGTFGVVLYYLIRISISALPFVMIGGGFLLTFLLFLVMYFFPVTGIIFWIWGLVRAISGVQDWLAIIYYICFVILFLPFFISSIASLISSLKPSNENESVTDSSEIDVNKKKHLHGVFVNHWVLIAVSTLLLASLSGNIYQYIDGRTMRNELAKAETELAAEHDRYADASSMYRKAKGKYDLISENYYFWRNHACIVPKNSSVYHIYPDCRYCDTSYFWIYNVEQAENLGYSLCSRCDRMTLWKD